MQTERHDKNMFSEGGNKGRYDSWLTRKATKPLAGIRVDLRASQIAEFDPVGTVDLFANDIDLLLDREIEVVQELEVRGGFTACDDCSSELSSSGSTLRPMIADDSSIGSASNGLVLYEGEFCRSVRARNPALTTAPN